MRTITLLAALSTVLLAFGCDDNSSPAGNGNHFVPPDSSVRDGASNNTNNRDAAVQRDTNVPHDTSVPHDSAPGTGQIGAACTQGTCAAVPGATAECLESLLILNFTGGYCSASGCSGVNPDPCVANGGVCLDLMMTSYCMKPCQNSSECREGEGYSCTAPPLGGSGTYCLPGGGMNFDGGLPFGDGGLPF